MGIWNRLEDVIKSYINGEDGRIFGGGGRSFSSGDPDLDAANEELEEFLSGRGRRERPEEDRGERAGGPGFRGGGAPEALRGDFAELGLPPGASAEECKAAYKRLLKLHHPDRHAGHPGNMRKATEKSARINAAYDRIVKWREGSRTGG